MEQQAKLLEESVTDLRGEVKSLRAEISALSRKVSHLPGPAGLFTVFIAVAFAALVFSQCTAM